jgi:hypothetical protein
VLTSGATFTKYTAKAAKAKPCLLKLAPDFSTLVIGSKTVALSDLQRPSYGRVTGTFKRVSVSELVDAARCFSLVSASRTWDLVAESDEQLVRWFVGLDFYIAKEAADQASRLDLHPPPPHPPATVRHVRALVDGERAAICLYGKGPPPESTYLEAMSP